MVGRLSLCWGDKNTFRKLPGESVYYTATIGDLKPTEAGTDHSCQVCVLNVIFEKFLPMCPAITPYISYGSTKMLKIYSILCAPGIYLLYKASQLLLSTVLYCCSYGSVLCHSIHTVHGQGQPRRSETSRPHRPGHPRVARPNLQPSRLYPDLPRILQRQGQV